MIWLENLIVLVSIPVIVTIFVGIWMVIEKIKNHSKDK